MENINSCIENNIRNNISYSNLIIHQRCFDENDNAFVTGLMNFENNGPMLCGISLGNSYYKKENIYNIMNFFSHYNCSVYPFIPGTPSVHTYLWKGDTENKANKKARLNHRRLQRFSLSSSEETGCTFNKLSWDEDIENNDIYKKSYENIIKLYDNDENFRNDVNTLTSGVVGENGNTDIGKFFLLKELSFLIKSPDILNEEYITYVYHTEWDILNNLLNGKYLHPPTNNVGFIILWPI